jgi:hypothetical protein
VYCSNCGAQNSEDATYCSNCGNELRRIETPRVDVPPPPRTQTQTSYAPQSSHANVPTYLAQAILTTLFCCLPFGIVSIVYAAQVNGKLAVGDHAGALQSSQNAKTWAWISFGTGLVLFGGYIVLFTLARLL